VTHAEYIGDQMREPDYDADGAAAAGVPKPDRQPAGAGR
jgi:hypothetical protein